MGCTYRGSLTPWGGVASINSGECLVVVEDAMVFVGF